MAVPVSVVPVRDGQTHALHVAVIGAGAAGLVTARELLREGHRVAILDPAPGPGGTWRYTPRVEQGDLLGQDPARRRVHSSIYESLRTNLPRELMSFSDFPFIPEALGGRSVDARRYCSHSEVLAFLEAFADEFDLCRHMQLGRWVVRVDPLPAKTGSAPAVPKCCEWGPRWAVTSAPACDEPASTSASGQGVCEYDAVVVCTGYYSEPHLPHQVEGIADFPGKQLHCHNYRSAAPFAQQRVLVVGASFSGEELARQVAGVATQVYHAARAWATPAGTQPRPNLRRTAMLARLTGQGAAVMCDGSVVPDLDAVIYCTGYHYRYPFLDHLRLITTDDMRVAPLWQHLFVPEVAPTLSFVGLMWKAIRNVNFEMQAKLVARVLAGCVVLPPRSVMKADIAAFYALLEQHDVPVRYTHNQSDKMPVTQWHYMDQLADMMADVPRAPAWPRQLYSLMQRLIFGRPDSFRDEPTAEELQLYDVAAAKCAVIWQQHCSRRGIPQQGQPDGQDEHFSRLDHE